MSNAAITKNKETHSHKLSVLSINYPYSGNFLIFYCNIEITQKTKYFFASACGSNITYADNI